MSGSTDPAVTDVGTTDAWGSMSTLVAGPVAWGAIGFGIDELTGSGAFVPVGVVLGFVTALWFVLHQHLRPRPTPTDARPTESSDAQGDLR